MILQAIMKVKLLTKICIPKKSLNGQFKFFLLASVSNGAIGPFKVAHYRLLKRLLIHYLFVFGWEIGNK
jgi:hypothetical protein